MELITVYQQTFVKGKIVHRENERIFHSQVSKTLINSPKRYRKNI